MGTGASARSRRHTSRPSMPGSIRSSTTRSGGLARARSSAVRAVGHGLDREAVALEVAAPRPRTPWRRRRRRGSGAAASITPSRVGPPAATGATITNAPKQLLDSERRSGARRRPAVHGRVDLIVVAKAPVPGRVKTRLCPPCTPARGGGARRGRAGRHAGRRVRRGCRPGGAGARRPAGTVVPAGCRGGRRRAAGDLDRRLATAWAARRGPALQIGMDTPQVERSRPRRRHRRARRRASSTRCWGRPPTAVGGPSACAEPHPAASWASPRAGPTRARRQLARLARARAAHPPAPQPAATSTPGPTPWRWPPTPRAPASRPPSAAVAGPRVARVRARSTARASGSTSPCDRWRRGRADEVEHNAARRCSRPGARRRVAAPAASPAPGGAGPPGARGRPQPGCRRRGAPRRAPGAAPLGLRSPAGERRWGSALLLDGNVGIGGDPLALLRRAAGSSCGRAASWSPRSSHRGPTRALTRAVERGTAAGPWFPWARVGADASRPGLRSAAGRPREPPAAGSPGGQGERMRVRPAERCVA